MVSGRGRGYKRNRTTNFLEIKGVSDRRRKYKGGKTTYFLEVERKHDGVRLWTLVQREQDNVLPGGGEEA